MDEQELIRRSQVAWYDNTGKYIYVPVYSGDGIPMRDIAFRKEGEEWVGRLSHDGMVEMIQFAEEHRVKK